MQDVSHLILYLSGMLQLCSVLPAHSHTWTAARLRLLNFWISNHRLSKCMKPQTRSPIHKIILILNSNLGSVMKLFTAENKAASGICIWNQHSIMQTALGRLFNKCNDVRAQLQFMIPDTNHELVQGCRLPLWGSRLCVCVCVCVCVCAAQ